MFATLMNLPLLRPGPASQQERLYWKYPCRMRPLRCAPQLPVASRHARRRRWLSRRRRVVHAKVGRAHRSALRGRPHPRGEGAVRRGPVVRARCEHTVDVRRDRYLPGWG